jgi:hypothetical protein
MKTTKPYLHGRRPRPAVPLAALATIVLLAGCARTGAPGSGTQDISHPAGPHDLILRVDTSGGFIAPQAAVAALPEFSLFGDGTVVEPGATPMIYPGQALPSAVTLHIDEAGIQVILRAARAAGLMGPSRHVGGPGIPDVGTTTITVVAGGARHVTTFNAAGMDGTPPVAEPGAAPGTSDDGTQTGSSAPTGSTAEAASTQPKMELTAIGAFRNKLVNLDWLPSGSVSSDSPYRPQELAVFVRLGSPNGDAALHEPTVDWPLADKPLSSFGRPWTVGLGAISPDTERCGVVSGADFDPVWTAASHANQLTPWRSDDRIYSLIFGLVLPDRWGACAAPTPTA